MSFTIDFPIPPTVNHIWKRRGKTVYRCPTYQAWLHSAGAAIAEARPVPISGPVDIVIAVHFGTGWRVNRDLDNCAKAPIDVLHHSALIDSDDSRTVQKITIEIKQQEDPTSEAYISVSVRPRPSADVVDLVAIGRGSAAARRRKAKDQKTAQGTEENIAVIRTARTARGINWGCR